MSDQPAPATNPNKALWEKGDFTRIAASMRESGRSYYGPTMNAYDAAGASGREEDLHVELEALFDEHNTSADAGATSIPATYLRVTVAA